ncbi:MAG: hypothetical protein U9N33_12620 [Campylobacterota bacterium]|nr:hypothetical protein [Campylobacterota bacterium]
MKKMLVVLSIVVGVIFSACASKTDRSQEDYIRANKVSAEALKDLEND